MELINCKYQKIIYEAGRQSIVPHDTDELNVYMLQSLSKKKARSGVAVVQLTFCSNSNHEYIRLSMELFPQ